MTEQSDTRPLMRLVVLAIVAALAAGPGCDRRGGQAAPADAAGVEQYGPYTVAGADYRVELTLQRRNEDESVLRMRIIDAAGVVHIDESYGEPAATEHGLDSTVAIVPWVLEGESGSALMLVREQLPSAPLTGTTIQVYAPRETADGVRLVVLFPPIAPHGEFAPLRTDGAGVRHLYPGDILPIDLWRSTHSVRIPLRLDLGCEPGSGACVMVAPTSREPMTGYGTFAVRAEPRPIEEAGAVELHEAPGADLVDVVTVRPGTSVDIIDAALDVVTTSGGASEAVRDASAPVPGSAVAVPGSSAAVPGSAAAARVLLDIDVRDEWLHVRIDGREGWVTGEAALNRLGLPTAG
jgi:hypothetical protein